MDEFTRLVDANTSLIVDFIQKLSMDLAVKIVALLDTKGAGIHWRKK